MILRQHAGVDEVVERTSVAEALPAYADEHFDFTLIDISRHAEDLTEFLHLSKKRQKTPVIAFTTSRLTRETLQLVVSDHVFAVFPKPFELEAVVDSVRSALQAEKKGALHPKLHGMLQKLHVTGE